MKSEEEWIKELTGNAERIDVDDIAAIQRDALLHAAEVVSREPAVEFTSFGFREHATQLLRSEAQKLTPQSQKGEV